MREKNITALRENCAKRKVREETNLDSMADTLLQQEEDAKIAAENIGAGGIVNNRGPIEEDVVDDTLDATPWQEDLKKIWTTNM